MQPDGIGAVAPRLDDQLERQRRPPGHAGDPAGQPRDVMAGGIIQRQLDARRRSREEPPERSEEHTSELQSLMHISYAVFSLKKKTKTKNMTAATVSRKL